MNLIKLTFIMVLVSGTFLLQGCVELRGGSLVFANDNTRVRVSFSDSDREVIRRYYGKRKHHKKVPPGLAKRRHMTPGHQNRLAKKGRLPPGLQGRGLPYDLERRLSPVPSGYVRLRVGTDLVLMNRNTRVIVDIIHDL